MTRDVSVIVPLYNSWHLTVRCLDALFATTKRELLREVIVVDDGSTDETRARLSSYPGVTAVFLPQNRGFAGACNAGARLASAPLIFFLNNDCFAWEGSLEAMIAAMDDPAIGVVGARLLFGDGSIQHAGTACISPGYWWHVYHHLDQRHPDANVPRDFLSVTGAAFLIRRELLEQFGAFDERYRTGFEDVDFCMRTWHRGYRVHYEPRATFTHLESATQLHVPSNMVENARKFEARWGPLLARMPHYELAPPPPVAILNAPLGKSADDQAGRQLARAIAQGGSQVVLAPPGIVPESTAASVQLDWLTVAEPANARAHIAYVAPHDAPSARATVYPSIDRYWAATARGRDLLVEAGVDSLRIELLRVGIDPQAFNPNVPPMQVAAPQARILVPVASTMPIEVIADLFRAILPEVQAASGAVLLMTHETADAIQAHVQQAMNLAGVPATVPFLTLSTSQLAEAVHASLLNAAETVVFAQSPDATCFTAFAAMACARLIVAPDAAPLNEVLTSENAVIVANAAAAGPAVREALRRPEQFIDRRKRARFDVERLYTTYFVVGHVRERLRLLEGHLQGAESVAMTPALAQIVRDYDLPA
jgi:GT2 family glycosyltransferase